MTYELSIVADDTYIIGKERIIGPFIIIRHNYWISIPQTNSTAHYNNCKLILNTL